MGGSGAAVLPQEMEYFPRLTTGTRRAASVAWPVGLSPSQMATAQPQMSGQKEWSFVHCAAYGPLSLLLPLQRPKHTGTSKSCHPVPSRSLALLGSLWPDGVAGQHGSTFSLGASWGGSAWAASPLGADCPFGNEIPDHVWAGQCSGLSPISALRASLALDVGTVSV